MRGRDREERRVDHRHAPFLPVGGGDHEAHAAHAHRRIGRIRIGRAEIEAPEDRILAARQRLRARELRAGAVRLEHAGKADALGVVAPMAERRRAAGRRERVDKPVRREAFGREPPRGIGEGGGAASDNGGDQHEESNSGTQGQAARLRQYPLSILAILTKLSTKRAHWDSVGKPHSWFGGGPDRSGLRRAPAAEPFLKSRLLVGRPSGSGRRNAHADHVVRMRRQTSGQRIAVYGRARFLLRRHGVWIFQCVDGLEIRALHPLTIENLRRAEALQADLDVQRFARHGG